MILHLAVPAAGLSATVRFPPDWRDDPTRVTLLEQWGHGATKPQTAEWATELSELLAMLAERDGGIEQMRVKL